MDIKQTNIKEFSFYNKETFKEIIFHRTLYGMKIKFILNLQDTELSPNEILEEVNNDVGCGRLLMNSVHHNVDGFGVRRGIIICRFLGYGRGLERIIIIKLKLDSESELLTNIDHWFVTITKIIVHKIKEYISSWG